VVKDEIVTSRNHVVSGHHVVSTIVLHYKFAWLQRGFLTLLPRYKAKLWPRVFVW